MTPIFSGSVENGRLKVQDKPLFDNYLNGLHGPVQIRIEKEKRTRSTNQNSYYWGVVLKLQPTTPEPSSPKKYMMLWNSSSPKSGLSATWLRRPAPNVWIPWTLKPTWIK